MGFAQFIADDVERGSHRGCVFINTIAELPDTSHAARRMIEDHKARQLERLTALCRACGLSRPDRAAIHITLILKGAQAVAQNRSVPQPDGFDQGPSGGRVRTQRSSSWTRN
jgi:hypothetical protein